jgi:hypothetical protein
MKLIEITINITTRHLEQERKEFVDIIKSIIGNNMSMTDDEFGRLLEVSSIMMKKYNVNDPAFGEIIDSFSKLINYHKNRRGK